MYLPEFELSSSPDMNIPDYSVVVVRFGDFEWKGHAVPQKTVAVVCVP